MNVTLLNYTPEALELLLLTKQTRLALQPSLLDEIRAWPMERKMAELAYMRGTIQSSWEFVDYTFLLDGVSRAFTHQLVRTRGASYAQQSQRTVDMRGFDYVVPRAVDLGGHPLRTAKRAPEEGPHYREWLGNHVAHYHDTNADNWYGIVMDVIELGYESMIDAGVPPQDARGVLPTNVATNIVMKVNLRTLADMAKTRLCSRTQGEYQDVFRAMRAAVVAVHPWAEPFIRVACAATGVCQFPNYTECPIKGPIFNPDTGQRWDGKTEEETGIGMYPVFPATRDKIQSAWETMRYEAVPHRALPVLEDTQ